MDLPRVPKHLSLTLLHPSSLLQSHQDLGRSKIVLSSLTIGKCSFLLSPRLLSLWSSSALGCTEGSISNCPPSQPSHTHQPRPCSSQSGPVLCCVVLCCVMLSRCSRVQLFETPWTVARQAPLSMGFSRQVSWSGLPCPSPGDLPNPRIECRSPTLQADSLPSEPSGKPSLDFFGSNYFYFQIKDIRLPPNTSRFIPISSSGGPDFYNGAN